MSVQYAEAPEKIVVNRRLKMRDAVRADTVERVPERNEVVVNRRLVREKAHVEIIHDVLFPFSPRPAGTNRNHTEELVGEILRNERRHRLYAVIGQGVGIPPSDLTVGTAPRKCENYHHIKELLHFVTPS